MNARWRRWSYIHVFHVNFKPAAERLDEKAASDEAHGPYGRRRLELGGLLGGCLGAARTVDAALRVTVAPAKIATGRHMLQNRQGAVIESKISQVQHLTCQRRVRFLAVEAAPLCRYLM
ncbi:hypothetical protein E4U47_004947 [Claviceps purpurea]|nr:hypothetical protein E4U38_001029 [Claviceps purpurea]KAG6169959.1 hypothetical protein E4U51_001208 [Claviceps purpurea]KAG6193553.1 hypothetical protein E4U27_006651 [Claviceps purpurea]KAG6202023.1 hypothetical protein E4U10_002195 [Claviceps purpurea]KAG6233132.1 hypothetical protein E4U26_003123 [Claviceps purpurea]